MTPDLWREVARELNSIKQLARGHPNDARIIRHVKRLRLLVRDGKAAQAPKLQTGTLRFQLWQRDPRCLWCGRETRIDGVHEPDAATLDHLHRKSQRTRRALPVVVLACRECNNDRGEPPAVNVVCPIVKQAA
jgi:5-methylcytosine-specific restriction endonuclease McrA